MLRCGEELRELNDRIELPRQPNEQQIKKGRGVFDAELHLMRRLIVC